MLYVWPVAACVIIAKVQFNHSLCFFDSAEAVVEAEWLSLLWAIPH